MRVVSLVPSLTETLVDYGLRLGDEVVGVTSFCVHPPEARKAARVVGGTKTPKIDRIVELAPDLVVVNREENLKEHAEALEAAGLTLHVTDIRTLDDARRALLDLGRAVGRADVAWKHEAELAQAVREVRAMSLNRYPVPVFVPIWKDPWMTFNGDTYAHDVLKLCGAENVFAEAEKRYPTLEAEDVLARGAKAVLLPSEPYVFKDAHRDEWVRRGIPERNVQLLDGEALTWYGTRAARGLREVARVVASLEG
ncbi:MAG TPA: helical backbone metal receptor [Candidatus Thermoplasmatota archaeon]|nr:helical backbone metal receptor [Candidatus Thermoplasmatota archaeon]